MVVRLHHQTSGGSLEYGRGAGSFHSSDPRRRGCVSRASVRRAHERRSMDGVDRIHSNRRPSAAAIAARDHAAKQDGCGILGDRSHAGLSGRCAPASTESAGPKEGSAREACIQRAGDRPDRRRIAGRCRAGSVIDLPEERGVAAPAAERPVAVASRQHHSRIRPERGASRRPQAVAGFGADCDDCYWLSATERRRVVQAFRPAPRQT